MLQPIVEGYFKIAHRLHAPVQHFFYHCVDIIEKMRSPPPPPQSNLFVPLLRSSNVSRPLLFRSRIKIILHSS